MKRLPDCYAVIDRDFGGDIDAYVDWVYDRSRFTSIEGVEALLDDFSHEKAEADPAMPLARAVWGALHGAGRTAQTPGREVRRGAPPLHRGPDAHAARQGVGVGCQLDDPSDLRTGAALRSGGRRAL